MFRLSAALLTVLEVTKTTRLFTRIRGYTRRNRYQLMELRPLQIVKRIKYKKNVKLKVPLFMLHLSLFHYKPFYFVSQDCLEDGNESIVIQENTATSTEPSDQTCVELSNGSAIPLVTFRGPKMEEDSSIEKTDDGCVEDCESFHPADLLSFAWQIARGMVSAKTTTFVCKRQCFNNNFCQ